MPYKEKAKKLKRDREYQRERASVTARPGRRHPPHPTAAPGSCTADQDGPAADEWLDFLVEQKDAGEPRFS